MGPGKKFFNLFVLLSILTPIEGDKFNSSQGNNIFFHQVLLLKPLKVFNRFISLGVREGG